MTWADIARGIPTAFLLLCAFVLVAVVVAMLIHAGEHK